MSHFRFMNQSKRLTSQSIWKITNFGKCTCSDQLLSSFSLLEFLFLFFFFILFLRFDYAFDESASNELVYR